MRVGAVHTCNESARTVIRAFATGLRCLLRRIFLRGLQGKFLQQVCPFFVTECDRRS